MTVTINGLEIFYEVAGGGPPVLLLHGNGEDGTIFAPLAAKLSAHYTVYVIDSRNHGRSGRSEDISYEAMAGDLVEFVRQTGLEKPFLVGFSDGAIIAVKAWLMCPGIFSRMVLAGINLNPGDFRPEILSGLRDEYTRTGDPILNLMLTQPDMRPGDLYGIDIPVLVIGAEKDMFKPDTFTTVTDALPSARMRMMYGHDHGSYIIGNDMLYRPIHDFFRVWGK